MNFGEIKTAVFAQIPQNIREQVSTFEFGEAIDSAQRLFATVLPAEIIPNLVIEKFIDRAVDTNATRILPLPEDFLRLEDLAFATERDDSDEPIRHTARLVSPEEFNELEENTEEFIATTYINLIHVWPEPCEAEEDRSAAVKAIYRKRPRPYMTTAGVVQNAARMHLRQRSDSKRIFHCVTYAPANTEQPFSYWGLDANELIGGYAYIGAPYILHDQIGPMYVARIAMAWEETGVGRIRISSDDEIPFHDESPGIGWLFPYCLVAERQSFGYGYNAHEAEDFEFPDIDPNWHNLVVDYALARLEIRWNPDSSKIRTQRVMQALQAAGAKLDYTKEN